VLNSIHYLTVKGLLCYISV